VERFHRDAVPTTRHRQAELIRLGSSTRIGIASCTWAFSHLRGFHGGGGVIVVPEQRRRWGQVLSRVGQRDDEARIQNVEALRESAAAEGRPVGASGYREREGIESTGGKEEGELATVKKGKKKEEEDEDGDDEDEAEERGSGKGKVTMEKGAGGGRRRNEGKNRIGSGRSRIFLWEDAKCDSSATLTTFPILRPTSLSLSLYVL
jgi:hypothetical protein